MRIALIFGTIIVILTGCSLISGYGESEQSILIDDDEIYSKNVSEERNSSELPNLMILSKDVAPTAVKYHYFRNKKQSQTYQSFSGEGILAETLNISLNKRLLVLDIPPFKEQATKWLKLSGKKIQWGKKRFYNSEFSPVYYRAAKVGNKNTMCIFFNMPYKISKQDHFERPNKAIIGYLCKKSGANRLTAIKSIFDSFSFSGKPAETGIMALIKKPDTINKNAVPYYSKNVQFVKISNPPIKGFPQDLTEAIDSVSPEIIK